MKEIILKKLLRDHRGINNAIKRRDLLEYCRQYPFNLHLRKGLFHSSKSLGS